MRGLRIRSAATVAAAIATAAIIPTGTAGAAPAGQTFLTGALPMPLNAIAASNGGYARSEPVHVGISANGRYVAFVSNADTLSSAAHPDVTNVFRKDRVTGAVVLVSRATGTNGPVALTSGTDPHISADGNRIAWRTSAALTATDTDGGDDDVYVRDIATATTYLASRGNGGVQTLTDSYGFDISGNGQYVVFNTDDALAGGADPNATSDIYRRNLDADTTALVSTNSGDVNAANAASYDPAVSGDGRWVAFASAATDVIAGYISSGEQQIYARNMSNNNQYLVSNQTAATLTGSNGDSDTPDIAGSPGDAVANLRVAYTSYATNVAAGGVDASGAASVYMRPMSQTSSTLVSRATGVAGANADSRAHDPSISDDGMRVVFTSDATNLGAGTDYYGVYLRTLSTDATLLGSTQNSYSVEGVLAGDGTALAWVEGQGITPDVDPTLSYVYARNYSAPASFGPAAAVSRPAGNAPFLAPAAPVEPPDSGQTTISGDGRYTVFKTYGTRLPGGLLGGIYRRDTRTGALELVSRANGANGAPAGGFSNEPSISADGNRIAFMTSAKLHPADTDAVSTVYVRDVTAGTTTIASRANGVTGPLPNAGSGDPVISGDGSRVAFSSSATNLGDAAGTAHAYVRDLAAGTTVLADRATGLAGVPANDDVDDLSLSANGRIVAFNTRADNIHPGDVAPDLVLDVYIRDVATGTTTLVSRRSGAAGLKATASSYQPVISGDGRAVAFRAGDQSLAPEGGAWSDEQIVARSLATHANTLVSRAPGGAAANAYSSAPSIDGDGSVVAFESEATNLIPGLGGGSRSAVFARGADGKLSGPPAFGLLNADPSNHAGNPTLSADGQCMAFNARGHNAASGPAGDFLTTYVYVISGACPKPAPLATPAARPLLTRVSLKHRRFRITGKRTAKVAAKRGRRAAPKGTAFRFTLNTRANVTFRIHRQMPGKRVGKACRKPSRKLRQRKSCKRFVLTGALARRGVDAGRHSVAFSGRIGRKALRPGRYRATLWAANGAGKSRSVRLAFRVAKP
jgi:Tol biopolymer transport system component